MHARALNILGQAGVKAAWATFWDPLFADGNAEARSRALQLALSHPPEDIARGTTVFHTRPDREALLSELEIPVVFVTGADDTAPGPESSARQAALARNGRLHVIGDCGHYVSMERPKELDAILREVIDGI
jgi:pimeloyl-ACP methyl ester carboxylesterase